MATKQTVEKQSGKGKPNPIPNSKPFLPGVSGNPNGRPKKLPSLDALMEKVMGEEKDGVSAMEAILKALRLKAAKGDVRAAEIVLNRAYGKPKEFVDVTTNGKDVNAGIIVQSQADKDNIEKIGQ